MLTVRPEGTHQSQGNGEKLRIKERLLLCSSVLTLKKEKRELHSCLLNAPVAMGFKKINLVNPQLVTMLQMLQ